MANASLGNYDAAIADYRAACSLSPEDEKLKRDLEMLEKHKKDGPV